VWFFSAREPEAEALLKAGLAKPVGRPGKKIRCLMLSCSRKQAHTFLRGGRCQPSQPSRTFKVERLGRQRLACYAHLPRAFGFGGADSLPIVRTSVQTGSNGSGSVEPVTVCEHLPVVDNSCAQPEIEIAVNPEERGSLAEKEGDEVTEPADLVTPRLCEARCNERPHPITHAETILEPDPSDISALRKLGAAVLVRAFEDARTDIRARRWFEVTPQPMLSFWCQVLGIDSEKVRRHASVLIPVEESSQRYPRNASAAE